MSTSRPTRRTSTRLAGVALAGTAVLAGTAGTAVPAAAAPAPAAGCRWTAQVLPTAPTTDFAASTVRGTDGHRTYAGHSNGHAVLWRDGRLVDLGAGVAEDVNRRGVAVGSQLDDSFLTHATLFRGGAASRLAEPAGADASRATGITDAGLIVGTAEFFGETGGTSHAVVWSARDPGRVTDLGTLGGDEANATSLVGVSERGTLIGTVLNQDTFVSTSVIGTVRGGLRALPGTTPAAETIVTGIAGRYVSGGEFTGGGTRPVRWVDGRAALLPGDGEAAAVNEQGTVVGRRTDLAGGLIWPHGRGPVDLPNPAGLQQGGATAVADRGTVGGFAFDDGSQSFPVLWTCR